MVQKSILLEKSLVFAARIVKLHKYLTKEKKEIEERLGSGEQMSNDEIMKLSSRMQEVIEELDEKEMIWLELNEKIS